MSDFNGNYDLMLTDKSGYFEDEPEEDDSPKLLSWTCPVCHQERRCLTREGRSEEQLERQMIQDHIRAGCPAYEG